MVLPVSRVEGPRGTRELAVGGFARYDLDRARRTGAPEVILAEGKSIEHLVGILRAIHRSGRGAFVSRPEPRQLERLRREAGAGLPLSFLAGGRLVQLAGPVADEGPGGTIAVLTAGTADVKIAEEASSLLTALGVDVRGAHDVGVAGIHRLERALQRIERHRPAAYLVFAGREGALPTVVAGLVRAPVVGIPVSVGYGRGGRGEAALAAMLQSCAPIAVMNIDAAIPAALFAMQLLSRAPRNGQRARRGRRVDLGPTPEGF